MKTEWTDERQQPRNFNISSVFTEKNFSETSAAVQALQKGSQTANASLFALYIFPFQTTVVMVAQKNLQLYPFTEGEGHLSFHLYKFSILSIN